MRGLMGSVLVDIGFSDTVDVRGGFYAPQMGDAVESLTGELIYNPKEYQKESGEVVWVGDGVIRNIGWKYSMSHVRDLKKKDDEAEVEAYVWCRKADGERQRGEMLSYVTDMKKIKKGDKVYFNYREVEGSRVWMYEGRRYLEVRKSDLYAYRRNGGGLVMLNGKVCVKPKIVESVSERSNGVIAEIGGIKRRVKNRGVVESIGEGVGYYRIDKEVSKGDEVSYLNYSERVVDLDIGEEVYVMDQTDIWGLHKNGGIKLLQDFLMGKEEVKDVGRIIIPNDREIREMIRDIEVGRRSENRYVTGKEVGIDSVMWGKKSMMEAKVSKKFGGRVKIVGRADGVLDRNIKVGGMVHVNRSMKGAHHLWVGDKVIFREGDVWGVEDIY